MAQTHLISGTQKDEIKLICGLSLVLLMQLPVGFGREGVGNQTRDSTLKMGTLLPKT